MSARGSSRTGRPPRPRTRPPAVKAAIAAANKIHTTYYQAQRPEYLDRLYPWYDCSASTAYVLYHAGLNGTGVTVGDRTDAGNGITLEAYGDPGPGRWITVYANSTHAFIVIAGLAFDTADYGGPNIPAGTGPRWRSDPLGNLADGLPYIARHPPAYDHEPRSRNVALAAASVVLAGGCSLQHPYSPPPRRAAARACRRRSGTRRPSAAGTIPPAAQAAQRVLAPRAAAATPQKALGRYASARGQLDLARPGRARTPSRVDLDRASTRTSLQAAAQASTNTHTSERRVSNTGGRCRSPRARARPPAGGSSSPPNRPAAPAPTPACRQACTSPTPNSPTPQAATSSRNGTQN